MRHQVKDETVGEDLKTSEKKVSDGGVTSRFGALCTRPIGACEYRWTDSMNSIPTGDGTSGRAAEVLARRGVPGGSAQSKGGVGVAASLAC